MAYGMVGTIHLMLVFVGLGIGKVNPVENELAMTFAYGLCGYWLGSLSGIAGSIIKEWSIKKGEIDKKSKLENVEKEKKVLEVAKKHAGLLTKGILLGELGIPFDEGEKILKKWVKSKVARKLDFGLMETYDVPCARVHLSKIDQLIMKAIIDGHGRATRTRLFSVLNREGLQVTMEALQETLNRIQKLGYITYDDVSDEYSLRGIV